ncbi:uncharacterized protein ColSpa_10030 [Colletotrichum spaethianum]|uniref:Uncharacterized protein n=1 Tax=Colletotrichum spaethianum TaxID=700344 RepID=A0AA37PCU6_9PEZI|nr:uncharacterized protein ColSpa_10030 [Colletotrichum spaethianum]GKT49849.1 hypothetical protein ColSpa_10030 [Colletotrichum spaethianum]
MLWLKLVRCVFGKILYSADGTQGNLKHSVGTNAIRQISSERDESDKSDADSARSKMKDGGERNHNNSKNYHNQVDNQKEPLLGNTQEVARLI